MALFRYLHDDAFLVFSREHKHLYAACLLDLHERFFTGVPAFPTPQQVVHAIYDVMRHLLPHASVVGEQNANSLQKAIVNAMTLDHDQTATEFVRNYILEKNNMRVGDLRESIQTYRNINDTIRKMRERLDALKALRQILAELEAAHDRRMLERWISKRAEWLAARAANREHKEKLRIAAEGRAAAKAEIDFLNQDIRAIEAEITRLTEAKAEHDSRTGRIGLQHTVRLADQTCGRLTSDFAKRIDAIRLLHPLCAMRGLGFDDLRNGCCPGRSRAAERVPEDVPRAPSARLKVGKDAGARRRAPV